MPNLRELGALERLPAGGGCAMFRTSDAVEYHGGERPPADQRVD